MSDDVPSLTLGVLKQIRDEIRELRGEARQSNTRLASLETKVEQSNTRLASLETKVEVMNAHLYSVHRDLRELIDGRVQGLERRLHAVEQHLGLGDHG